MILAWYNFFFQGDVPLDLMGKFHLSIDWKNNDKLPGYVLIQSKELVRKLHQYFTC